MTTPPAGKPPADVRRLAMIGGGGLLLLAIGLLAPAGRKAPQVVTAAPRAGTPASTDLTQRPDRDGIAEPQVTLTSEAPMGDLFAPAVRVAPTVQGPVQAPPPGEPLPRPDPPSPPAAPRTEEAPSASGNSSLPSASDMRMLGVVVADEKPQVLLRNAVTGQSRYLEAGAEAWGFSVGKIESEQVTLVRGGESHVIEMSKEIRIEGPGGSGSSAESTLSSSGEGGSRDDRRAERRERRSGGGEAGGFNQSEIFALPTWTERLKKLEEAKGQMEPERYERLKRFMEARAAAERPGG